MKRIVIWESQQNISGGQRVALNIVGRLKEKFLFKFFVPSRGKLSASLEEMGIDVTYIPAGNYRRGKKGIMDILTFLRFTPSSLWRSYKHVKDADMIYANSTRVFIWSTIMGSITGTPVIWHLHNLLTDQKAKFLLKLFGEFNAVKKIISVSYAARDHSKLNKNKIEVIYNGVDISKFKVLPSSENKAALSNGINKIGIIGDLLPQKGHSTLIKAINIIKDQIPIKLLIVGSSTDNNNSYENELKNLVNGLNLNNEISFTGHRSDIPDILGSLDLLVIPSSSFEACPMVALEAFACGIPVIGSDLGGTPELIEDGRTGYVFRANDENDLADKMLHILKDPALRTEMAGNCRKIAEQNYDLSVVANKVETILNNIL